MTLEVYKSAGKFRWRVRHVNRNIVDASTQGYSRYRDCRKNLTNNGHKGPKQWLHGATRANLVDGRFEWH